MVTLAKVVMSAVDSEGTRVEMEAGFEIAPVELSYWMKQKKRSSHHVT